MSNLFRFLIILFTFTFLLFTFSVQPTFATNCPSGTFGTHYYDPGNPKTPNTGARLTGVSCTIPSNWLESPCALPTGRILRATYCMAGNDRIFPGGDLNNPVPLSTQAQISAGEGCIETFQQEVKAGEAPPLCDNPKEAPSEIGKIFGTINAPQAIQNFGFGSVGISKFLSNLIVLIYSMAAVVLVLMILWGSFDWIISEGEKEKIKAAQDKILNAIIGIMLFAVAFAAIKLLGQFTGFTFFQ